MAQIKPDYYVSDFREINRVGEEQNLDFGDMADVEKYRKKHPREAKQILLETINAKLNRMCNLLEVLIAYVVQITPSEMADLDNMLNSPSMVNGEEKQPHAGFTPQHGLHIVHVKMPYGENGTFYPATVRLGLRKYGDFVHREGASYQEKQNATEKGKKNDDNIKNIECA